MKINKYMKRNFFVRNKSENNKFYNYNELPLYKLGKFLERDSKDIGFWLNQLKPGYTSHKKENFDIPVISWIDLDFHTEEQINDFKKDVPNPKQFMEDLKNDSCIFFSARTLGGGIRIAAIIESYYIEYSEWFYQDENNEDDEDILNKQDEIFEVNNIIFAQYLEKYGIKSGTSYFDTCSNRISQPTFPVKKGSLNINIECDSIKHYTSIDALNNYNNKLVISDEDLLKMANKNESLILQLYYNEPENLKSIFDKYNPELMAIIKFSDVQGREAWFSLMKKYYTGKSFKPFLKSLSVFNSWMDCEKSLKSSHNLYWFLKKKNII